MPDLSAPIRPAAARSSVLVLGAHRFDLTHQAVVIGVVAARRPAAAPAARTLDRTIDEALALAAQGADVVELSFEAEAPAAVDQVGEGRAGRDDRGPGGRHDEDDDDDEGTDEDAAGAAAEAVAALCARVDVPVAVASSHPSVVRAGLAAGASLGRHPGGVPGDHYLHAIHAAGAAVIVTAPPHRPSAGAAGVVDTITADLVDLGDRARALGLDPARVLFDPGVGRAAPPDASLVLRATGTFAALGHALVVSLLPPADAGATRAALERRLGPAALAIGAGARLVRTGDVHEVRRVAAVMAAILGAP